MAKLRHIAIVVDDSEATAAFYTSAFGLKEVFRQKNDQTRGQWVIYLRRIALESTDGAVCCTALASRVSRRPGRMPGRRSPRERILRAEVRKSR